MLGIWKNSTQLFSIVHYRKYLLMGPLLHRQMVGSSRDLIGRSLTWSGLLFFILPMFHTWHMVVLIMRHYILSVDLILDAVALSVF